MEAALRMEETFHRSGGFLSSYPSAAYIANACANFNRDGIIDGGDFPAFRDNFLANPLADCPKGDINNVF